jgi:DNA mismatch repair protein MutS
VPKAVIRQAKRYLQLLEDSSITRGNQADLFAKTLEEEKRPPTDPLREAMARLNPDELSPREALELLYRLKKI